MRLKAGVVAAVLAAAATFMYVWPASADVDQAPGECHPSYDPCVPIAADVDCESGEGNGPVFIDYPVQVIGADEYDLDRDGNGIGCEDETGIGPPLPEPEPEPEPQPEPQPEPEPEPQPAPAASPAEPVAAEPTFTG